MRVAVPHAMNDVNRYYEIFELEPGASPERVKQAYRDLVKVWHPDRFAHDPRLHRKAQEKLKEINEAYEQLQAFQPGLRTHAFQATPRSNESYAGRSRISRKRKIVLVSAASVLFVVVIYIGGRLSRFEKPGNEAHTGPEQMSIPVDENISTQELIAKGRSFYLAKDYRHALPYFQKAIEKSPRHAKSWYQVGYCNYKLGRYQEAVQAFQEAVHLKPEDAEGYKGLGLVYAKQRRFQDAIGAFKQAAQLKPGDAAPHYNLGVIYLRIGDRDGALTQYEILRTLNAEKAAQLYKLIS